MRPHSQTFKPLRHGDQLGRSAHVLFLSGKLPQDGGADQSLYRVLKGQGGGDFVTLMPGLYHDGSVGVSRPQVAVERVAVGFLAMPLPAAQAIGGAAVIVDDECDGHGSFPSEGFADNVDEALRFRLPAGHLAERLQHRRDAADQHECRRSLIPLPLAHAHGSAVVRCGHIATECA